MPLDVLPPEHAANDSASAAEKETARNLKFVREGAEPMSP
jgi:hypothetical protein